MNHFKKFSLLSVIVIGFFCFFYFNLYQYLSLETLKEKRAILEGWTEHHYILISLAFIAIYITTVALTIPGATILTLTGGFLFGITAGTIYVVIGATLGACIIFYAAKTAFREMFYAKSGKLMHKMEAGFKSNAFNYMLFLRLLPIFPFFVINIIAGLLGIKFRTFFFGTLFGIIPGSLIYVSVGNSLNAVFDQNKTPDLGIIFQPQVLIPIIALALISLIPILYKKYKNKTNTQ
jgi:uncharacterized membrane protein YdjX (TVP38/TMEM64 family)